MLLSMTGYGDARHQGDQLTVSIELRALNNRYLKVSVRAPDPYHLLEAEFEKVVRRYVRRGTLQLQMRLDRQASAQDYRINAVALASYYQQLREVAGKVGIRESSETLLGHALTLPGVVPEGTSQVGHLHDDWPLFEKVLEQALKQLNTMRQEEGRAMAQEMLSYRDSIRTHLERIRQRIPLVASSFRDRLYERVRNLLSELDVKIDRNDVIREVSIYSERSDIAEEVVRLSSHLDQFQEIMNEPESPGRKLEFLTQEMSRETNTIGSKASDVEMSREVVEIKGTLEKIRELVQNVE